MRPTLAVAVAFLATFASPPPAAVQRQADVDAVNRVIDQYGATDDAGDMTSQAKLMSADRVWVAGGAGRRTDQATNMRVQQEQADALKKLAPGLRRFTEDRDRLIRFYGNGSVAVASFYRYVTVILPPNLPTDVAKDLAQPVPPAAVTLVLEKRDGEWKIVHTHFSLLASSN